MPTCFISVLLECVTVGDFFTVFYLLHNWKVLLEQSISTALIEKPFSSNKELLVQKVGMSSLC